MLHNNQIVIFVVNNLKFHEQNKYIEIDYYIS